MDDWLTQSAEMADIYANGYFNIAAAAATNSSEAYLVSGTSLYGNKRNVNVLGSSTNLLPTP